MAEGGGTSAFGAASAPIVAKAQAGLPIDDRAELRNVTILFADIVNSTRTLSGLDPEDARVFLDRAIELMIAGVRKFGGTIGRIQGDGLMAVFGTPAATEDHALRGCLAGIAIRDAFVSSAPSVRGQKSQVRIGLHTGGIATRPQTHDFGSELDAIGPVVHLAAKIERLCPANGVTTSNATIKLTRGFVRSQAVGVLEVGEDEPPLEVAELLEVSPDYQLEHYFSRRRLSPFVGRERELKTLKEIIEGNAARPAVVGLIGEAGLGKSRLCFEAQGVARRAGVAVAEIRGAMLNSATPFAPLASCLSHLLRDLHRDEGLASELATMGLDASEVAAVKTLTGLGSDDPTWLSMPSDARKKATVEGVAKTVCGIAERRPLLLIVEDLHDIDHETRACLSRIVELSRHRQLRVFATSRPEGSEALAQLCPQILALEPLPRQHAVRLVQNELRNASGLLGISSGELLETVLERANGNPFILEEIARGLTAPNSRGIGGVPISVEILIRSRVDKISPTARHLLYCASVIGMRFGTGILRRAANLEPNEFEQSLRELVREKFLVADSTMQVEFVHQITRDACYEGITRDTRARLHHRVLEAATEKDYSTFPLEVLAEHAYRAGEPSRALDFLWEACRDSISHSAVQSVANLRKRALAICAEIGPEAALRRVDFELLTFDALQQLGAYAEIVGPLEEALRIAEEIGGSRRVCQICGHLGTCYWILGNYERAYKLATRALEMAHSNNDLPLTSYATFVTACIQFNRGHIQDAVDLHRRLCAMLSGKLETARFGAVAIMSVMSRSFLCWFLCDKGELDEAGAVIEEALRVADSKEQPYSQLLACAGAGYRLYRLGRIEEACAMLDRAYNICRAGSFLALDQTVSSWYAAALIRAGRDEEAMRLVRRAIENELGRYCCVISDYYIAEDHSRLLWKAGRKEEALKKLEEGIDRMVRTRDAVHYAHGLFSRAELKRANGAQRSSYERDYRWALRRARRIGMKPLQAQCETAIASLH